MLDKEYRVAIYCRLAQEDEFGLWAQQRTMRAFAESLGFRDYGEYADNGHSGRTLERPAFSKMMEEVRAGNIHTICIRDTSRISRDYVLFRNWMEQIQAQNVNVVSLHEKNNQLSILESWAKSHTNLCDILP